MNNLTVQAKTSSVFNPTFEEHIASFKFLKIAKQISEKHSHCLFNISTEQVFENTNGDPVFPKNAELKIEVCKKRKWGIIGHFRPLHTLLSMDTEASEKELFSTLQFATDTALINLKKRK